ncbi:unannotated protein [freshwater metagenome]|uniref:Unannotated protein n=1 Tax=freshwater metagenome TaxID=449393 RepID=A0A6J7KJF8_9ZZZZ|nr:hypothetical protein [Actinomycetota bacterium]MSW37448.1 hypothetical protein [Actinomycetota bacterium]MSX38791.1 hypothetical protein [Actinomycetota bacterium]
MSRHLPLARPGRPVLRRGADQVQIGIDPERAVIVDRLSDVASSALVHLDGTTARHEVLRLAPELDAVLDQLHERGLLDDDPGPTPTLGATRRERLAPDIASLSIGSASSSVAVQTMARRARSAVVVRGHDRVAAHIALGLASAGVGTVALQGGDHLVSSADFTTVGPHEPHLSWREEVSEAVRRQGAHPTTLAMRTRRPVLTIVCSAADIDVPWTDPELADDLLGDSIPHLAVAVAGEAARVGPLVIPGHTACLWCLDHRSRDLDQAWPALADQIRLRHSVARAHSGVLATVAAGFAVAQSLHLIDGPDSLAPVTTRAQVEFRAPDALGVVLPVVPHPVCGCGWGGTTLTMVV